MHFTGLHLLVTGGLLVLVAGSLLVLVAGGLLLALGGVLNSGDAALWRLHGAELRRPSRVVVRRPSRVALRRPSGAPRRRSAASQMMCSSMWPQRESNYVAEKACEGIRTKGASDTVSNRERCVFFRRTGGLAMRRLWLDFPYIQ